MPLLVSQVVPLRSGQGELRVLDLPRRNESLEVLPFSEISAALVLDLAGAQDGLSWLVVALDWVTWSITESILT